MGETEKTREQLTQELAQAQKRIAEFEAGLLDSNKPPVDHNTLKTFFDSATDSFSIWDSNLNMVYLNDATLLKYYPPGTKRADIIGKHFTELVPGSVESGRYARYLNVLKTGEPVYIDEFTPHPRFGDMYLAVRVFKIKNGLGIITIDNTERKRMEQTIRDSQQRLSALIENAPDVIFTYDTSGRFVSGNKKAEELMGYSREELLGKTFIESGIFTEESLAKASERLAENRKGKQTQPIPFELIAKDSSHIFVEVHSVPIVQGDKVEVIAIARDITERKKAAEALQQSEEKFRIIFNCIADGISLIDLKTGKLIDANEAALRMFNFTREDVIGMNAYELIAKKDRQRAMEDMVNTLQTGDSGLAEWCLLGKGGTEHDCEARASVIRDSSWNPLYLVNVIRDRTEQKQMEEKLRQSEEKLRRIFESIGDAITIVDIKGIIVDANETAIRMSGSKREEHIGRYGLELLVERDRARAVKDITEAFSTGYSDIKEYTVLRKDGSEFPAETISTVLRDAAGEPVGLINILRDITERKRMEEKLRQSEEKIRQIFNSVGVGISVTDIEGKLVEVNDFGLSLCGCSKEEMTGQNGIRFIAERDRPRIIAEMINAFETGKSGVHEFTALKKDGTEYETETIATVIRDGSGKPAGLITSVTDITERKRIERELNDYKSNLERMVQERTAELANAYEELRRSEEDLRKSEEKLRIMFSSMADGVVVIGLDGKTKDLNEAQLRLFEYDRKEDALAVDNFSKFIAEKDRDSALKDMFSLLKDRIPEERVFRFISNKGREFTAEIHTSLLYDSSGNPTDIMCVVRDITERKHMEEALRESETKLRAIFNSITDGIAVTDMSGRIVDENEYGAKLMGYASKEGALGLNGFDFIAEVDRAKILKELEESLTRGYGGNYQIKLTDRYGKEFDSEVMGSILSDSSGQPTGLVCVMRDITERKRMEETLRESEEWHRALVETSGRAGLGIAIIQSNEAQETALVFVNDKTCEISGYAREELLNMSIEQLIPLDTRDQIMLNYRERRQGEPVPGSYETAFVRKDKVRIPIMVSVALMQLHGKPATVAFFRDITERKQWEAKLKESKDELRFYLNQITKAQEEERKKIARELHDDTIQELITLSRQLDNLIDKKIKPNEDRRNSRKKIEEAQQKVDAILKGVRRFTRDLRPSVLDDLGLIPTLEWLASDISSRFGIPINLSIVGAEQPVTPDAALAMFRIAQESLRNAGHHAKASQIQLNLKYSNKTATLSIIDNGVGFTLPKQTASLTRLGKLGVVGMYERAQIIGATLSIKSKRNKGTTITLEVPIK